jgi:hypothetical protein
LGDRYGAKEPNMCKLTKYAQNITQTINNDATNACWEQHCHKKSISYLPIQRISIGVAELWGDFTPSKTKHQQF